MEGENVGTAAEATPPKKNKRSKKPQEAATLAEAMKLIRELQGRVAAAEAKGNKTEKPAGTLSTDVSGHPGEDGEMLTPLVDKSHEHIFRVHNGLHPETGKPVAGVQAHSGEFCKCQHCIEHVQNVKAALKALPPKGSAPTVKTPKKVEVVKKAHNEGEIRDAILNQASA